MIVGYVIYNGEEFLTKDGSTGPMATGGYPWLSKTCKPFGSIFESQKDAERYFEVSKNMNYLKLNEKPAFTIRPVTLND